MLYMIFDTEQNASELEEVDVIPMLPPYFENGFPFPPSCMNALPDK